MPITNITIENFKGIGDRVDIPIRPITLLFGANSAGKSTILQSLLYLRELLERQNTDADKLIACGSSIDLGGFSQFVHGHDLKATVRIGVEISVDADGLPTYDQSFSNPYEEQTVLSQGALGNVETVGVEVSVEWDKDSDRPWITGYSVKINGTKIGEISAFPGSSSKISFFDSSHSVFTGFDEQGELLYQDSGLIEPVICELDRTGKDHKENRDIPFGEGQTVIPEWGKAFPMKSYDDWACSEESVAIARHMLGQIFIGSGELVLNELQRIRHIGSFRDIPERSFNVRRSPADDRWANGAAAWDLLYNSDLKWFDADQFASLGMGYEIDRQTYFELPSESALAAFLIRAQVEDEIYLSELESLPIRREVEGLVERTRLRLIDSCSKVEVAPCDVGVGVSQVLPVVVGAMAPGYSVLSVEQPELHIHPAVQCALADVLAHQVIRSENRCLLLETHSEHLMLRWLRRIREQSEDELPPEAPPVSPDHLSVLYVQSVDGRQKITPLPVTDDGEFAVKWPKGFFEERADELF